jgi:hypothetical protein
MIRVLSVIGHGVNLIPHFIDHYSKYVDEIQFVVYQSPIHPTLINDVKEAIKDHKHVKIVKTIENTEFDWGKVTALYNLMKSKNPNDWWVIADIDEFHLYPNDDLKILITNCNKYGWDLVWGGFIDRIGPEGTFSTLEPNTNIFNQYPNAGFFRYPMSKACPNKVCVMKGYIELTDGQHYAKIDGHTTWKWQGWNHPLINPHSYIQVHHFKWDSSSIERIKAVADVKQSYSYSDEYKLMYDRIRKSKFKIDLTNPDYMFETCTKSQFGYYKQWNKLIKKIITI